MDIVYAVTGATVHIDARVDDGVESDIKGRLERITGVKTGHQILLIWSHTVDGASVRVCPQGRLVTLRDHEVDLPLPSTTRFFLFDKMLMQPNVGAPPMEKLPQFADRKTGRVFQLMWQSIDECIGRQDNRIMACEASLCLLSQKVKAFEGQVGDFEAKWTGLQAQNPSELMDTVQQDVGKLKETKLRPELATMARRMWDLYAMPEADIVRAAKSTKAEFQGLRKKMVTFKENCQEASRAARELLSMRFPSNEEAKRARDDIKLIAEHQQLNLDNPADYVSLARAREKLQLAEQWANNVALACWLRLQKVTERENALWMIKQQILDSKGVMALAMNQVVRSTRVLKVLHELPALQHTVIEEALRRGSFRDRMQATVSHFGSQLEPVFLEETNRRAAWISDQSPYVRDWISENLGWLKEEPLRYVPAPPIIDKALPVRPHQVLDSVIPFPLKEAGMELAPRSSSEHVQQLEARIEYLEGELSRRLEQLESAQSDFRKREVELTESNLTLMRQSVPFANGISQMAAALTSQKRRLDSAFVVEEFMVGDRVCFARRKAPCPVEGERSTIYEVLLGSRAHVYMSWSSQRHLQMESELVIARLIDEPRRFTVNDPSSTVYGLQQGTEYYELVVVEESFCNYDGTPVMEQPESNSDNINNSNL